MGGLTMFGIGPTELVVILVLALVIFGPGKLPEVGNAIGKSVREFKRAVGGTDSQPPLPPTDASNATREEPGVNG